MNLLSARLHPVAVLAVIGVVCALIFASYFPPKPIFAQAAPAQATPDSSFLIRPIASTDMRYLAVGDSYTCGTGAAPEESWPSVLTRDLRSKGVHIDLAANLGVDGWTTRQALDSEAPQFRALKPEFATLMIGVNDTYRDTTPQEFRALLTKLIDEMRRALPRKSTLLLVTIPDFTVTPRGASYNQNNAGSKIRAFNGIIQEEARKRDLPVVDVYALSQKMKSDPTLIASDSLHPSAKEYALWEAVIFPAAFRSLRDQPAARAPSS